MKYFLTFFFCGLLAFSSNFAQSNAEETDNSPAVMIHFDYAYQFPAADMADRFNSNSDIGFGALYKTRNNWLLGVDGQFLFGGTVKEDFASNVRTSEGFVLGANGFYAELDIRQQGVMAMGRLGKIFSKTGAANPNSGFMFLFGVGYFQHKIQIENRDNNIAQFQGDYRKGYDRLTSGLTFSQFIGYTHMSLNRRINFFIGIEAIQGFTQGRRSTEFNTQADGTSSRTDILFGPKIGWIFPIYIEPSERFFTD